MAKKKIEHIGSDETKEIFDHEHQDGSLRISDDTSWDIILADLSWQLGSYLNTDEFKRSGTFAQAEDYLNHLLEVGDEEYVLTPEEKNYVMSYAQDAYSDPDCVLVQNPEGRIAWMDKSQVRDGDHVARSVKQVIQGYADALGADYDDVCNKIDPDYDAIKTYDYPEGNFAVKAVDALAGGRYNEISGDPQLMSKKGAVRNAILGDVAEGATAFLPVGLGAKVGKTAVDGARVLPKILQGTRRAAQGAGVGAVSGIGSYTVGQVADEVAPSGNREDRGYDFGEASTAAGLGALGGGIGGAIAPVTKRGAGKAVLKKNTPNETAFESLSGKELDNMFDAAKAGRSAYTGDNPYVFEAMNDPKFDVEFEAPKDFLPERGRVAADDELGAGRYFKLEDNPAGGKAAPMGSSGIKEVASNQAAIDAQQKAKDAALKTRNNVDSQLSKLEMTQLPKTEVSQNDNQLALIDQLIADAEAEGKNTSRLELMRAKLLDDNAKRTAGGANADAKITAGNNAKNSQIADLYKQKVAAQRTLDEAPLIPKNEYKLVNPDERLANEWSKAVNDKYNIHMSPDNAKRFLAASQGGPERAEYQMTHGRMSLPRKELNERRGLMRTAKEDQTYKNEMYKLYGEFQPKGVKPEDWAAAKQIVSGRETVLDGANKDGDKVGGRDFWKQMKDFRGGWALPRRIGQTAAHTAGTSGKKAWDEDEYQTPFIPTK